MSVLKVCMSICSLTSPSHSSDANVNWERLLTGQLFLSTVVSMFADDWNCPSSTDLTSALIKVSHCVRYCMISLSLSLCVTAPSTAPHPHHVQYLQLSYSPRIEDVVSVYHQLCDDVRSNAVPLDPSSPSFPPVLLKPECQVIALLLHTATLNPTMVSPAHLLPCVDYVHLLCVFTYYLVLCMHICPAHMHMLARSLPCCRRWLKPCTRPLSVRQ